MIAIMATGPVTRTPNTTAPPVLTKPRRVLEEHVADLWPALRRSGLPPGRIDNTFPHRCDPVCLVERLATRWAVLLNLAEALAASQRALDRVFRLR
jgi:hypothetical protein